jgi:hypothetical protein
VLLGIPASHKEFMGCLKDELGIASFSARQKLYNALQAARGAKRARPDDVAPKEEGGGGGGGGGGDAARRALGEVSGRVGAPGEGGVPAWCEPGRAQEAAKRVK